MAVVAVPFDRDKLRPGHNNTILGGGIMPAELGLPVGTHYGLLKPGMAQEPAADKLSKLYIPLEGEADLVTPDGTYRLKRGTVFLIERGTHHEVRQVGEADFINVCVSLRGTEA